MNVVRGFLFVGNLQKHHNANKKHTREEVSAAIKQLKMKHTTALFTEEYMEFIADLCENDGSSHYSDED